MAHSDSPPATLVTAFVAAWNRRDLPAIEATLAPDVVYHNIPMAPVAGREAVMASLTPFVGACSEIDWRILNLAVTDSGVVLTERVDDFVMAGGRLSVRVMGVFEIRDGLIAAWRDYFDPAELQPGS
jgi:limonene-1,2-epoxide hydrolase